MKPVRRAVVDVGTNSIKLLVAEFNGFEVRPLLEESKQTRLGQGFYPTHVLQPGPIAQTVEAIAAFRAKAAELGAGAPKVVATSAVRDARNREELISAVKQACGLLIRVISGEEEADYGFKGVTSDPSLAKELLLLLDVGGGSTEFILGQGHQKHFTQSVQLGTVRLLEELRPSDPPSEDDLSGCRARVRRFVESEISPELIPALRRRSNWSALEVAPAFWPAWKLGSTTSIATSSNPHASARNGSTGTSSISGDSRSPNAKGLSVCLRTAQT